MRKDAVYLQHILDAIGKIAEYVSVGYEEFMAHSHWQTGGKDPGYYGRAG